MAWSNIADTQLVAGRPIVAEFMNQYLACDEALREHMCGGKWESIDTTRTTSKVFVRAFIPRHASGLYIECESGVDVATGVSEPQIRLWYDDGLDLYYSDWTSLLDSTGQNVLVFPKRVQFARLPISTDARGQTLDIYYEVNGANDTSTTRKYYMRNYPSAATGGYGLRFE